MKIAILSTYTPQKCGIATYSHDLYNSLITAKHNIVDVIAIADGDISSYPSEVKHTIQKHIQSSYIQAADVINAYDVCIIQHEYGIFGGECGEFILDLCNNLHIPIITNFHTILPSPSAKERKILQALGKLSTMVTVMTNWAVNMLHSIYNVSMDKMHMIPHGVPVFDYNQENAKNNLGLTNQTVLLSFGFLGRGKGFETAIKAVSQIKELNFKYIILGITHPNVLKEEGEIYRESLMKKCQDLGIKDSVIFVNQFASDDLLKEYLTACDMYVTPYPHEGQISSGTLTFALGAGAAVISTPYLYAKDLLANERGLLFDFKNSTQLSDILNNLIENPSLLQKYRRNAREHGEKIQWPNIGKKYISLIKEVHTVNMKLFNRA